MSNKEVEDLVKQVTSRGSGWTRDDKVDGNDHIVLRGPDGECVRIASTPSDSRWKRNSLADLKRAGWDPEEVERENRRISRQRATDEIEKARLNLIRAQEMADARQAAAALLKEANAGEKLLTGGVLKGYPTEARYVSVEEIRIAVDLNRANRCNTRPLYKRWVAKWQSTMGRGAWHLSPEALVFDEHGCLVDGMHRGAAYVQLADKNPELLLEHYPHGIPFTVVTDFPSALVGMLNSGKSRSAKDAVAVAGHTANAFQVSAALRLVMAYDQRFGERGLPWTQWGGFDVDNDEVVAAFNGPYAGLIEHHTVASRLRRKIKMTPSASLVLPFLLSRDGHSEEDAETFINGICLDDDYRKGDARAAFGTAMLRRVKTPGAAAAKVTNKDSLKSPGPYQLCLALKAYYKWQVGDDSVQILDFGRGEKAYAVWTPGMKLINGEVRVSYRNF